MTDLDIDALAIILRWYIENNASEPEVMTARHIAQDIASYISSKQSDFDREKFYAVTKGKGRYV